MDFDKIILTDEETKRLEKLVENKQGLPRAKEDHVLYEEKLIYSRTYIGEDQKAVTLYYAYPEAEKYLKYIDRMTKERKSDRWHDWVIAFFSVIAGAFLSRPLWEILDWLLSLFRA